MSGEWIEADHEQQARQVAQQMCDEATPKVELWQGARQLAVLPCRDGRAA